MRALLKDVDLETLYSMRRQKMSNQEIAESLGVSYATVLNLIGKQPSGLRKKRGSAHVSDKPVGIDNEVEPAACLIVEKRCLSLIGSFGRYEFDVGGGFVDAINAAGQSMRVSKDQIEDFINELSAIKRKMEVMKLENEAW